MPKILSNVVERDPMYSSKVFPTLRLSAATRIALETISGTSVGVFLPEAVTLSQLLFHLHLSTGPWPSTHEDRHTAD